MNFLNTLSKVTSVATLKQVTTETCSFLKSFYNLRRRYASTISSSFSEEVPPTFGSEVTGSKKYEVDALPSVPAKLNIVRLSKEDAILSKLMLKVKSRKTRAKSGLIMLEGKRLILDACSAGVLPVTLFFSNKKDLDDLPIPYSLTKLYEVAHKDLQVWSDLTTSSGMIAICKMPQDVNALETKFPVTVICDQIREPGNLGSIIRNAAGAGVSKVILTSGCTDLWDPKVLRGGAGAHFRLKVFNNEKWDSIDELLPVNAKIYLADINENKFFHKGGKEVLPIVPYYSVNFQNEAHIGLVIGGETEGLSKSAYSLARQRNGARLNIPLSNQIDSLNTAAALSVILFEIKRQLAMSQTTSDVHF